MPFTYSAVLQKAIENLAFYNFQPEGMRILVYKIKAHVICWRSK
jgi:hypothetical protein